jgi:amino acid transporter
VALIDHVFGPRLATAEEEGQRIGPVAGVPMLGLDALASASYGPEAALTVLLALGVVGLAWIGPISLAIIALLFVLYLSYRQTIAAYPHGAGSYTVAKDNLGSSAGLLAAAALLLDYVLVVAVGISAGVGALISAVPALQPYTVWLCLAVLTLIAVVNLRGVRESGLAFILPTYLFVGCLGVVLGLGLVQTIVSGGQPTPVVPPPPLPEATASVSLWLLVRAFASGCTAMTGVEAVSNGIGAFRVPTIRNATTTLTVIVVILAALLAGIAVVASAYHVGATEPGQAGYESVLSQVTAAVVGRGAFYYLTIGAVLLVLGFSANTGFAALPRVCSILARDDYLPHAFAQRGRRLVFSLGIFVLTVLAGGLLIVFGGVTDRLIPLFAVGAFLAFTLSQAGMVRYWRRVGGPGAGRKLAVNAVGAVATGAAAIVVLVAKFAEGAWITLPLVGGMLFVFSWVHRHYRHVARELTWSGPLDVGALQPPLVVVPIKGWDTIALKSLRFAYKLSVDIWVIHVAIDEATAEDLRRRWPELVDEPAREAGLPPPRLVVVPSPYRQLFEPLLQSIDELKSAYPDRQIAIIIPSLVEHHWLHYLLHNQRAEVLKAQLLARGDQRTVVVNVPWYMTA